MSFQKEKSVPCLPNQLFLRFYVVVVVGDLSLYITLHVMYLSFSALSSHLLSFFLTHFEPACDTLNSHDMLGRKYRLFRWIWQEKKEEY